jgi:predicted nucleic acid-binding Zn ribbon protein
MRRSKTDPIGSLIQQFIDKNRLSGPLQEIRLINSWPEVVGKAIARHTEELFIKERTLFIRINSPVVRRELGLLKQQIIDRLNEKAGIEIIHSIRIL